MENKSCNECGKLKLIGWKTGRDVQTVSYYCKERKSHVSPGEVNACPFHVPGDPWAPIKEAEKRYDQEHHAGR